MSLFERFLQLIQLVACEYRATATSSMNLISFAGSIIGQTSPTCVASSSSSFCWIRWCRRRWSLCWDRLGLLQWKNVEIWLKRFYQRVSIHRTSANLNQIELTLPPSLPSYLFTLHNPKSIKNHHGIRQIAERMKICNIISPCLSPLCTINRI